jgi:hypothetical protein
MAETENQERGGRKYSVRVSFPYPACLRFDCLSSDEAEDLYRDIRRLLIADQPDRSPAE